VPPAEKDDPVFINNQDRYEKSVFNLFLWALLTSKLEIAKVFLKLSQVIKKDKSKSLEIN
jgi:hypothetical protein